MKKEQKTLKIHFPGLFHEKSKAADYAVSVKRKGCKFFLGDFKTETTRFLVDSLQLNLSY